MLVTFDSKAGRLTMFGDVAVALLKLMGHSGTIPGALLADDIPAALEQLRRGVESQGANPAPAHNDDSKKDPEEPQVLLSQRAFPLIQLLENAAKRKVDVMWDVQGKSMGDYV